MKKIRSGPGRPRKYGRPSRPVTVTLPDDVISRLSTINTDVGQAIVTVVERQARRRAAPAFAEVSRYGRRAVIVVNPVRALRKVAGVQLVPIGAGRALIALEPPHSVPELELAARDLIERPDMTDTERRTLTELADILRHARESRTVALEERTIIVLEERRGRQREHAGAGRT
jgi:hypothetical protein